MARLLMILSVILLSAYVTEQVHFLQPEYINKLNEKTSTWKAGENFPPDTPIEYLKGLLGSRSVKAAAKGPFKTQDSNYNSLQYIPETFDARKQWKRCKTIGVIRDQGNCGSCWAFGTTGAFSDRLCIATDGEFNELLSAEELTFCCHSCGDGCGGGDPIAAWDYFSTNGIVTGGGYDSKQGCQPYFVPPCLHGVSAEQEGACRSQPMEKNHRCTKKCYGNTTIDYKEDHRYTSDLGYYLDQDSIQEDVLIYGPVEASFEVYDDFVNYKSGVYIKSENATYLGGHAVKLIGWGVEKETPYWLMVNSWNENWGDRGTFKIRRGTNECQIDSWMTAGVPVTD
ncbi:cathepsin B-like isoform X3 [Adelges cooleyi]|uniref:cathepsin B-like isoform X3 n=1 Tax=Adelges cooleyi TaxID=133065 RepID=UPI002180813E|nr:cathepsin B-like isoform X3 [Adelges cooleyi]